MKDYSIVCNETVRGPSFGLQSNPMLRAGVLHFLQRRRLRHSRPYEDRAARCQTALRALQEPLVERVGDIVPKEGAERLASIDPFQRRLERDRAHAVWEV